MTNRKLAVTLLVGAGLFGLPTAYADVGGASTLKVFGSSKTDVATQVTTGTTTTAARLRHNQNDEPGHEQPAMAMFVGPNGDGITGLFVDRASNLYVPGTTTPALKPIDNGNGNGNPAQGAMALFQLANQGCGAGNGTGGGGGGNGGGGGTGSGGSGTTGSNLCAKLVSTFTPTFITNHPSQDNRAFNQPNAYTINGGSAIAVEYNYRVNQNGARTTRWLQVFNAKGQQILVNTKGKVGEQQIYAKQNDDCNMNMDGHAGVGRGLRSGQPVRSGRHLRLHEPHRHVARLQRQRRGQGLDGRDEHQLRRRQEPDRVHVEGRVRRRARPGRGAVARLLQRRRRQQEHRRVLVDGG